jgi:hypothetical protein
MVYRREQMHHRFEVGGISREVLRIYLHLAGKLVNSGGALIIQNTFKKSALVSTNSRTRQCRKFQCLYQAQYVTPVP